LYEVVVETSRGEGRRLLRLWNELAAPPHAVGEIGAVGPQQTVRGQLPFPKVSLSKAAAITAIAAGAIAAPVVYHNQRMDNRSPHSP
jgi:hypothetical protein